jgi:ribonucleoside-triphosphate reductase
MNEVSTRAQIITRRTYNRPLNEEGTIFESWEQTIDRVIEHQQWLWERAKDEELTEENKKELAELKALFIDRKSFPSGRTLWLGGTDIAKKRESSMFNCSFEEAETVRDAVDGLWLLMQGCGLGFTPITGTLNGFSCKINDIIVINTERTEKGGREYNEETYHDGMWTISVGDSAESWSKALGKLLAGKHPNCHTLVLDFSEIRPAGERLKGYGWISSGDEAISRAFVAIAELMNRRAGHLLTAIDILDVYNWMGTILSSRRSAEICLLPYGHPEWREFALAKRNWWENNPQRAQSNNSLVFYSKPSYDQLSEIFDLMKEAGGSEPGFINGETALKRAPWFKGCNPLKLAA